MIDMHLYIKALKVTWIRRFLNSDHLGWVTLFSEILNIYYSLAVEGGHQALLGLPIKTIFGLMFLMLGAALLNVMYLAVKLRFEKCVMA